METICANIFRDDEQCENYTFITMNGNNYCQFCGRLRMDAELVEAIHKINYDEVVKILSYGANPNHETITFNGCRLEESSTPLIKAVFCAVSMKEEENYEMSIKIIKLLIKHKADVNAKYRYELRNGTRPLQIAIKYGRTDILGILLDSGADIFDDEYDPISFMLDNRANRKINMDIIEMLVNAGASYISHYVRYHHVECGSSLDIYLTSVTMSAADRRKRFLNQLRLSKTLQPLCYNRVRDKSKIPEYIDTTDF